MQGQYRLRVKYYIARVLFIHYSSNNTTAIIILIPPVVKIDVSQNPVHGRRFPRVYLYSYITYVSRFVQIAYSNRKLFFSFFLQRTMCFYIYKRCILYYIFIIVHNNKQARYDVITIVPVHTITITTYILLYIYIYIIIHITYTANTPLGLGTYRKCVHCS